MRLAKIFIVGLVLSISAIAQTSLKPGNAAPIFALSALDGTYIDLEAMRGSVVVITFWSTKCEICRNEMPKLNSFISRYDNRDVVFLAASMEGAERIESFLRSNPTKLTVLPNSFGVVLQYADRDKVGNIDMGFPAYFVIDKNGMIAYRAAGWNKTKELGQHISQLLGAE